MCKVMMMVGIKPENNMKAQAFIKVMAPLMSFSNKDGIGYAAVDKEGRMFGERWLDNGSFLLSPKQDEPPNPEEEAMLNSLEGVIKLDTIIPPKSIGEYGSFGDVDLSKMTAITLHTRMATSAKGFANVHPFIDEALDTSVIHNGIIRNDSDFNLTRSTCDSESILISYLDKGVGRDMTSVQHMIDSLVGYYACGVFSRDAQGQRVMDYFKGNGAQLHTAYIKELGTYALTTSAYDIKEACTKLNYSYSNIFSIADGWIIRLNPITGQFINKQSFTVGKEYNYTPVSEHQWPRKKNSWEGAQTYIPETLPSRKDKSMSKNMIDYMSLPVAGRVFSMMERREYMNSLLKEA